MPLGVVVTGDCAYAAHARFGEAAAHGYNHENHGITRSGNAETGLSFCSY